MEEGIKTDQKLRDEIRNLKKENDDLVESMTEDNNAKYHMKRQLDSSLELCKAHERRLEEMGNKLGELELYVAQHQSTLKWYVDGAKQDRERAILLYETIENINASIERSGIAIKHLFTSFMIVHARNIDLEEFEEMSLHDDLDPRGEVSLREIFRLFRYIHDKVLPGSRPLPAKDWMNQPVEMKGDQI